MKNLKKVLALGLALVMLLGMFTIASAAESKTAMDLTDWDSVEHKDAVALMVDLGIINGKPDGSFDPNGNIDRASWAKMVYYAATGSDDADAYLGTSTGLKDISGNWAESYISYLKANEYISGDNNGNYNPGNNVTVAEANKMMLTVLGYDAEDRGYQNSPTWSGNIMNDAKKYGLMDDVDRAQTALVPLTRENAAQIVYNAMKANTVEKTVQWDGGVQHITRYYKESTLGYDVFGVIAVEIHVDDVNEQGYADFGAVVTELTDSSKTKVTQALGNKVKASMDVQGSNVIVWLDVNGMDIDDKGNVESFKSVNKVITSFVNKGVMNADAVFTKGFKWSDITNSSKSDFVATGFVGGATNIDWTNVSGTLGQVKMYINGENKSDDRANAYAALKAITYNDAEQENLSGAIVEFYLDEAGELIDTIRAYIYSVAQLTGDAETRTSAGVLQVRVPGVVPTWTDADKVSGYQGLKEDDVVTYYKTKVDSTTYYTIEKPEKVTGVVKGATSSHQITMNGVKYKRTSADSATGTYKAQGIDTLGWDDFADWDNFEDEFALYLDKSGAVCFVEQVTETVTKSNIALVMAAEWNGTSLSVDSGNLKAKLLFIDGTQQIVPVSKIDFDGAGLKSVVTSLSSNTSTAAKQIVGGDNESTIKSETGKCAIDMLNATSLDNHYVADTEKGVKYNDSAMVPQFYNYKVVNGAYELTRVIRTGSKPTDWKAATAKFDIAHVEPKADFSNGDATGWTADSKTVFLVAKGQSDAKTYYQYTSYKNIPEMKGDEIFGLVVGTNESGAAKYVFLDTESYSDDAPDGYIFIYNNKYETDPDNEDAFLVNIVDTEGNQTTMSVDSTLKGLIGADKMKAGDANYGSNQYVGHFFVIDEIDENGVVHELTDVSNKFDDIEALGNEVANTYSTDSITKFVFVDMQVADGDDATIATDDVMTFSGCGTFNPNNFYKDTEVCGGTPGQDLISDATGSFASVKMAVIADPKSEIADYVYVLRIVW